MLCPTHVSRRYTADAVQEQLRHLHAAAPSTPTNDVEMTSSKAESQADMSQDTTPATPGAPLPQAMPHCGKAGHPAPLQLSIYTSGSDSIGWVCDASECANTGPPGSMRWHCSPGNRPDLGCEHDVCTSCAPVDTSAMATATFEITTAAELFKLNDLRQQVLA